MKHSDFFNVMSLSPIKMRIYGSLVHHHCAKSTSDLKNKIKLMIDVIGVDPSNYRLSSLLDALASKIDHVEFNEFLNNL